MVRDVSIKVRPEGDVLRTLCAGWAVSIVVKGELANDTVNYDAKIKAYVPI